MKSLSATIQVKATEQYFPVVLFIMLYKVVLTFEFVDEILKCDHSSKSYWAVLSCGTVCYAAQGGFQSNLFKVSLGRLPSSKVFFVRCDRILQRAL